MANQEEEVLGKAYDGRLMRRLLTYLRPYRIPVAIAVISIILKAGLDVLGPYLTKTAVDKYLAHVAGTSSLLDRWLSSSPMIGIAQLSALYLGILVISFFLEFLQTYFMSRRSIAASRWYPNRYQASGIRGQGWWQVVPPRWKQP